ncbi:MAG: penicillin acylase family protein [Planctomycetota bacterium]
MSRSFPISFSSLGVALAIIIFAMAIASPLCAQSGGGGTSPPPEPVTIYRDPQFAPHFFGTTDAAAFCAFGRAQMMDLPVSTSINFAGAAGELAAYRGRGAFSGSQPGFNIAGDRRTWLWRIPLRATALMPTLSPYVRGMITAYVAGINKARLEWLTNASALANNTSPIALDLDEITRLLSRKVTVHDVICHGIQINGNTAMFGLQGLAESEDENASEELISNASNSWLIGESASSSGNQILMIDPHLGLQLETQYRSYFAQITGPGISVCGISFPAWPCIAIGYNNSMAWAVTTNSPDSFDAYKAPLISGAVDSYPYDSGTRPVLRIPKTIGVWDFDAGTLGQQIIEIAYAGHFDLPILREGPDKNGDDSIWYGKASFTSAPSIWTTFIGLGRSATVATATALLMNENAVTYSNFLIGDNNGAKGYLWAGRVPIRGNPQPGTTWSEVQDGTKSFLRWHSIHPASDLPFEFQPGGSIVAPVSGLNDVWIQCNARADYVRPVPTIDLDDYPQYMVHKGLPVPYRQIRAHELLRLGSGPFTIQEAEEISIDTIDLWWRGVRPLVPIAMGNSRLSNNAEVRDILRMMFRWDMDADVESAEAVVSLLMFGFYQRGLKKLKAYGIRHHDVNFRFPETVPSAHDFRNDRSWRNNHLALAYAVGQASRYYNNLVNKLLPNLSFSASPWTPTPWAGLSTSETVLGHVKYMNFTPASNAAHAAVYPVPGGISLYALFNDKFKNPLDGLIENFGLLGQTGPFLAFEADAGVHTALYVELGATPQGRFLEALGPTEIDNDPRRYANAADFTQGIYKDFNCDEALVATNSVFMEVLNYEPEGDVGSAGGP